MILLKTAKALEELQPGSRQLPQRARSVLLMAGGKRMDEIQSLLGADHAALAQDLVDQGYLQLIAASDAQTPTMAPSLAPARPAPATTAPAKTTPVTPTPAKAAQAKTPSINMAGTRMYLFDMCERLFANRHHSLAQDLREQLRQARDLQALRGASLRLLSAVQEHAGEDRAQSLRERLAGLLAYSPEEMLEAEPA
jgi:hypothetical protein